MQSVLPNLNSSRARIYLNRCNCKFIQRYNRENNWSRRNKGYSKIRELRSQNLVISASESDDTSICRHFGIINFSDFSIFITKLKYEV